MPEPNPTNSLGMTFVPIEPGTFAMGNDARLPADLVRLEYRSTGDFDERPVHEVTISKGFRMAATPVTNAQYEQFDPAHSKLRGKLGFSKEDDEAIVFVSWDEAVAFCRWLSEKEGETYRLPTEAEWEYACRAGTKTAFSTGDELPAEITASAHISWYPDPERSSPEKDVVPLTVGRTQANPWGLFDMHGLVEEWCADWYGPYPRDPQTDPVGPATGDFRVTRGGSHSTETYFLRSANRMGTVPDERSWLLGFRVVKGDAPASENVPGWQTPNCQLNVSQAKPADVLAAPDPDKPYFSGPRLFVKIPPGSRGPIFYHHNHVPAICECPNGDMLAAWYTCTEEPGREVATVASRLRYGADEWEEASLFWDGPDRNDHASALWYDGEDTIHHFVGLSAAATWGNLATLARKSTDSGATWAPARFIIPEHGPRHMPIACVRKAHDGTIILACDAVSGGHGGSALWMSRDGGETFADAGGTIAGIHANVVQLDDGRLLAFGRGDNIDGRLPMSISCDMGKSWEYSPGPFQPVHTGQRLSLLKLREGPIFFAAFANEPVTIRDAGGNERQITGLYCAVSMDDGATWENYRPVSDDAPDRLVETMDGYRRPFGISSSELAGYTTVTQARNGLIHFISSRDHYVFNLKWLTTPPPAL